MEDDQNREGHAPEFLQDSLIMALKKSWAENRPWWDQVDINFSVPTRNAVWDPTGSQARASWLLGQLWNSKDVAPDEICMAVGLPIGSSYASLARNLKKGLRVGKSPEDQLYPY